MEGRVPGVGRDGIWGSRHHKNPSQSDMDTWSGDIQLVSDNFDIPLIGVCVCVCFVVSPIRAGRE